MLDFVAFGRDTMIENLLLSAGSEIPAKGHRYPSSQDLAQHNHYEMSRRDSAHRHEKHKRGDQAVIKPEHNLTEPIAPMRMLLIDLLHIVFSYSFCDPRRCREVCLHTSFPSHCHLIPQILGNRTKLLQSCLQVLNNTRSKHIR